ncbi:hypothetical protein [Paenibacillus sp. UNC451MF]|uniref:hypothetical protein n=1 Tax=Paenibacillus sp. UNC451MF TaxID=1449063 RepID=UPI00048E6744|nr:hypothetical protein [Paenibacillus sp. UNC451MF]
MKKFYIRLLIVILCIGFCIFFGVDLATRGVERIQGPMASDAAIVRPWQPAVKQQDTKTNVPTPKPTAPSTMKEEKAKEQVEPPEPKAEISKASGINRLGNKIGELLQILAFHTIKLFVALFDTIT